MTRNGSAIIWIGQAEVAPQHGDCMFQKPALGGFIASAAYAGSEEAFRQKVIRELEEYGVLVRGVSDVRRLSDVLGEKTIEKPLATAIEDLTEDGVALGTLFTFQYLDES